MSLYNDGETVKWGKNNLEWYVIGEHLDYYFCIIKGCIKDWYWRVYAYEKDLPCQWENSTIHFSLQRFADYHFSDEEKSVMLYDIYVSSGGSCKCYASLLTKNQVERWLPVGSAARGIGERWWLKKDSIPERLCQDFVATDSGFETAMIDSDCALRPVIGVKKSALRKIYPKIDRVNWELSYAFPHIVEIPPKRGLFNTSYDNADNLKINIISILPTIAYAIIAMSHGWGAYLLRARMASAI